MKKPFKQYFLASLAAVVMASFALAPVAEAARDGKGGGGGGGGGGGNRAASAGGGSKQVDRSKADARSTNVRSTSANSVNNNYRNTTTNVNNTNVNRNTNVNNTNVNRNTNVNISVDNNNGWDNDYHPVGTALAVGAAVAVTSAVIGTLVQAPPPGCVPVNYGGMVYQQCGATWYQPQGPQFIVVNPPY
jgi:hypothetical protein